MKVLWVHNFNPSIKNSGVFMHQFHHYLKRLDDNEIDISIYYVGDLKKIRFYLAYLRMIRKKSKDYDIVHVQYGSMLGFLAGVALFKTNCVKILSIRGSDWYFLNSKKTLVKLHSYFSSTLTRLSLPFYNVIIPVSNAINNDLKLYSKKSSVLVSPIDLNKFNIKEEKNKFKNKQIKTILFASLSVNSEIKRFDLLKRSIYFLNHKEKNITYRIVTASDFDNNDMCDIYNSVDLLCLPSAYEGWPNVVKEALACGTPFVSTDVSDLNEVAKKAPHRCFIADDKKEDFSRKIKLALSTPIDLDEKNKLRKIIENICGIEKSSRILINIYSKSLGCIK